MKPLGTWLMSDPTSSCIPTSPGLVLGHSRLWALHALPLHTSHHWPTNAYSRSLGMGMAQAQDCQHCGNLMRLSKDLSLVHSPLPCKYLAHPSKKVAILLPPWVGSVGLWGEEISSWLLCLWLGHGMYVQQLAGGVGQAVSGLHYCRVLVHGVGSAGAYIRICTCLETSLCLKECKIK